MYCKIKNRECPHAGMIETEGCKDLGEKEEDYTYTVCYKEGGRLACSLGI